MGRTKREHIPDIKRVNVKLPADLHEQIVLLAEKEHRSLHKEIINAVEAYIEQHNRDT